MVVSVRTSIAKQIKKQQRSSKKLSVRQARIRADRKYYRNPENQKALVSAFIGDLAEATFSPETFSYRWNQKFGNLIKSLQPKMPNGRRKSIGMHAAYENPRYRRMFNVLMHRDPEAEVEWEAFRRYFLNGVVKDMILDRPLPARAVNTLSSERKKRVRRAVRKMDTRVRVVDDQADIRPVREEQASDTREERVPRGAVSFEAVEMENGAAVASNRSDDKVPEEPLPATERVASHPGVDINLMDPAVMEAERRRNWRGVDINLMEPERDEEAEELEALLRSSMVSGRPDKRDEQAVEVHESEKEAVENEAAGKGLDSVSDNQSEEVEEVSAPAADPVTAEREESVLETVFRMSEPNSDGVTIAVPDHGLGGWEAVMPEDTPVAETAENSDRDSVSAVVWGEAPENHAEPMRQPENETVQQQEETAADRAARWEAERSQKRTMPYTAVNAGIKQPENSENAKSRRSFRFGATLMRNPVIRNLVMVAALAGTITGAQVLRNHLEAPVSRADTVLVDHHNNDVREIVENGAQKDRGVVETKTASKPTVAVEKESVVTDTVVKAVSQQDSAPSVQPVTQDVSKEPVVSRQDNAPSAGAENAENGSENKSEEAVKKPETKSEGTPGATTSGENEMPIVADNDVDTPVYTLEDIQNAGVGVVMTEEAPYQVQIEDVPETAVAEKATLPEAESKVSTDGKETVEKGEIDQPSTVKGDQIYGDQEQFSAQELIAIHDAAVDNVAKTHFFGRFSVKKDEIRVEMARMVDSGEADKVVQQYRLDHAEEIAVAQAEAAKVAAEKATAEQSGETKEEQEATAENGKGLFDSISEWYDSATARKDGSNGIVSSFNKDVVQPALNGSIPEYTSAQKLQQAEDAAVREAASEKAKEDLTTTQKVFGFGTAAFQTQDQVDARLSEMEKSGEAQKIRDEFRKQHAEEIAVAQAEAAKVAAEKATTEKAAAEKVASEKVSETENESGGLLGLLQRGANWVGSSYDQATTYTAPDGSQKSGIVSSAKDHLSAMGESETGKLPQTKGELAKQLNEGHHINRTVLNNRTPGSASGR